MKAVVGRVGMGCAACAVFLPPHIPSLAVSFPGSRPEPREAAHRLGGLKHDLPRSVSSALSNEAVWPGMRNLEIQFVGQWVLTSLLGKLW